MKRSSLFKTSLALLVACLASGPEAQAATTTYNAGDVFLTFRAPNAAGVTQSLIINIGSSANYTAGGGAFVVGSYGADLNTTFGNVWSDNNSLLLFWSASGITDNAPLDELGVVNGDLSRTLYATKPTTPGSASALGWTTALEGTQNAPVGKIFSFASAFSGKTVNTAAPNALIQLNSVTNSFNSQIGTGNSFAYFGAPKIEGNFGNGAAGTALDFYTMQPTTSLPGSPGEYNGRFTINSTGVVTFTPVPEAGTSVVLFAAIGFLACRRTRRLSI